MAYTAGILLGRIIKTSGFEGAVSVKLEKEFVENIPLMESVFIETDGRPVPFFIAESEYNGGEILKLTFDGYTSETAVRRYAGCRIFTISGNNAATKYDDQAEITGFNVYSSENELIGVIEEISENKGQWLLGIRNDSGRLFLVPLHEDLVIAVDSSKKELILDIPEGLLDLN